MKVNIYYGGRGLIDDPTLYVINTMQEVLEELNVRVERYNLFELKSSISALPQTLKEADGIILATTVEWFGIGGYMQSFLDACWQYGDKEKISRIYMCPVVISTCYGEKDGKYQLESAWEILGGKLSSGLCGYIQDVSLFEQNEEYGKLVETKTENLYRTINQKRTTLPVSRSILQVVAARPNDDLTPQETEQLSQYVSDDSYVQKSKEDIQELVSYFREKLEETEGGEDAKYVNAFFSNFNPQPGVKATYQIQIEGRSLPLVVRIDAAELECQFGQEETPDADIHLAADTMDEIIANRLTFQRAFMSGNMKLKGDFKLLRMLDQIFSFGE